MGDFNFFLPYIEKKKQSTHYKMYFIGAVFAVLILISGSFLFTIVTTEMAKVNYDNYETKIQEITSSEDYIKVLEKAKQHDALSNYNNQMNSIIASANSRKSITQERLVAITSAVPAGVRVITANINEKQLVFTAVANSRLVIATYETNLKALDFVLDANIELITKGNSEYSFAVTCNLK